MRVTQARSEVSVIVWGLSVKFQVPNPTVLSKLITLFLPGWQERELESEPDLTFSILQAEGELELLLNGAQIAVLPNVDQLLTVIEDTLHQKIATHSPDAVFIHAGAVRVNGRVLIIPGRSRAGKSTLVRALVKNGAAYLSDEYAVLDRNGLIHAYPRAMSIRLPHNAILRIPARDLGWASEFGDIPTSPSMVLNLKYLPNGTSSFEEVPVARGLLGLLENTVSARVAPERALRFISKAGPKARFFSGSRGEASQAAAEILRLLEETHPSSPGDDS